VYDALKYQEAFHMRRLLLVLALAILGCGSTLRAGDDEYLFNKDVQTLLKVTYFGFGPFGYAAKGPTTGEAALKRIMKEDEAIKYLMPVFEHGTPEGKCYALAGFRLLSKSYFNSSCSRISPWNDTKVKTFSGCVIWDETLQKVVNSIRAGEYDNEVLGIPSQ
jgi:hypothetical protein